jgi:hypothetical protein
MFAACKIEDTLKKSKEILVAARKIRNPSSEVLAVDDPVSRASLPFDLV